MDGAIGTGPLPDAGEVDEDGLVSALMLDGKGGARAVSWTEVKAWAPDNGVLWVHLNRKRAEADHYIRHEAGLDPVAVEALLAEDTRPRVAVQGPGLLINFRGVNVNPGADPEDMVSLRIWIQKRRIITVRARRSLATLDVQERLNRGGGPLDETDCLLDLARALLMRVGHVVDELSDTVDALEDEVVSGNIARIRDRLAHARRRAIAIRRHLAPQREALSRLQGERHDMLDAIDAARFRELADETARHVEALDSLRERALVVQDEVLNRLTERQNRNSYVLTVVAAIMLPLSFITSLFGVSLSGIPLQGNPDAFWILVWMLAVVVLVEIAVFRWTRWL